MEDIIIEFLNLNQENRPEFLEPPPLRRREPIKKPSVFYCKTGRLEYREKYDQTLSSHSSTPEFQRNVTPNSSTFLQNTHFIGGNTIKSRSLGFYTDEEILEMERDPETKKPSKFYCKTGHLDIEIGEQYDPDIHLHKNNTIRNRSLGFYTEIEIIDMQLEMKKE